MKYYKLFMALVFTATATATAQIADYDLINDMLLTTSDSSADFVNNEPESFRNLTPYNNQNDIQKNLYKIGDFAFGGIVFYVDESGEHGLVCAKNDQSTGAKWEKRNKVRKNERLSEEMFSTVTIFNGKSNNRTKGSNDYASRICKRLKIKEGGVTYNDWYLPSKEELNLMYLNKDKINSTAIANGGKSFEKTYYWSATEYDYTSSWVQYFENGKQAQHHKNYYNHVRAIRAF
ncbi:MAG: DUF1566 domain-containing protein [Candidatus Magasanikbacteria bacterium]|nr:DUF1566 domain-containing protein [Candidatus Magasanikbacteria bacterium]